METYWITGVQLGILIAYAESNLEDEARELTDNIIDNQLCDNSVREDKQT